MPSRQCSIEGARILRSNSLESRPKVNECQVPGSEWYAGRLIVAARVCGVRVVSRPVDGDRGEAGSMPTYYPPADR